MSKTGDRVGAILGANTSTKVVEFLGYGVYEGDHPIDVGGFTVDNPRIKLDNGEVTWGCECWWGPEDVIKRELEGYEASGFTVSQVSIDELRKSNKAWDTERDDH